MAGLTVRSRLLAVLAVAAGAAIDVVTLLSVSSEHIMSQATERFTRLMPRREEHRPATRTDAPPDPWEIRPKSDGPAQKPDRKRGRPDSGRTQQEAFRPGPPPPTAPVAAPTDADHLAERLGLYVIIVLGEGVIQIVDALTEHWNWDLAVVSTALGACLLLIAIWYLSLLHGFDGVPLRHPPRSHIRDRDHQW